MTQGMLVGYTSDLSVLNDFERDLVLLAFREIQLGDYFQNPRRTSLKDVIAWRLEEGQVIGLHLRHLHSIPHFLDELPSVRELIIFAEDLDPLPTFPWVSRLVLVNMGLGVRMVDWGNQPSLRMLQLIGFQPPSNKELGDLEILSMRRMHFDVLSDRILKTRLIRLELSNITGNINPVLELETLEDLEVFIADVRLDLTGISRLKRLKTLILFDVGLNFVPEEIGELRELEYLDLGKNNLYRLPETLGNLHSLKILKLRGNRIKSLPESLGRLKQLIEVDFRETYISQVPAFFGRLPNLFRLQLEQVDLEEMPPLNLRRLVYLSFFECYGRFLPYSVWSATDLTTLLVWQTPIKEIPPSIGNLRMLRWLFLRETSVDSLPAEIGNLVHLEKLNIENCPLRTLPTEITRLRNLEFISVHSLVLESFPEGVATMPNIQRIELYVGSDCLLPADVLENPKGITIYVKRD
ncbi:MAG: leucine-rich repeat domain-containing protein [Methanobacteriota archaeon]|nr:MAG: leucine-rich repeat domain-containing protein [Euryarchaeota archaeon]